MNSELWSAARVIFEQAIELQSDERVAFVRGSCGENVELLELVSELLEAHEDSTNELEPPSSVQLGSIGLHGDGPSQNHDIPGAPTRIGAYKIIQKIGSGGMGTIYEAHQDSPKRSVALKIMREGFATERARGRFMFEAEVLGRLQHTNIARVFESGIHDPSDDASLPWFALEYVANAQSVLGYANSNSLSTEERLELFMEVCAGVHHGHQKGIIHRDLKASNVLVGADGVPKVIDFGVACLVETEGEQEVEWTLSGEVVGTLGAMSPEQLRGSRKDVDICTDVYSLGALLFELLAGEPALDLKGLSLPAAFEKARIRNLRSLRDLRPDLPSELEWIVARAMEFDPGARYASVSEFTADIRRFLANEPVLAGPHTRTYHFLKFVSRNRWPVLGATALLLLLIGALAWVSAIYRIAEQERSKSVAINEFMGEALSTADPSVEGPETRVVDALGRAFELSAEKFENQPEVHMALLEMVGEIYHRLGEWQASSKHLEEAIALRGSIGEGESLEAYRMMGLIGLNLTWEASDPERSVSVLREAYQGLLRLHGPEEQETLIAQNVLGFALSEANQDEEAEQHLRASHEAGVRLWGEESLETASLASRLGQFLMLVGELEEAERLIRQSYEVHINDVGAGHTDTLSAGNNLAGILLNLGRASEGLELMEQVHAMSRKVQGPGRFATQRQAIVLGNVRMGSGDFKGARVVLKLAVDECLEHFGELHALTLQARQGLGTAAYYDKDLEVAERELRSCIEAQVRTVGSEDENTISVRNNLGMMLQKAGKLEEAEELLRVNLEIRRRKHGNHNPGTLGAINNMGFLLLESNRLEEAGPLIAEALKGRREVLTGMHPSTLHTVMNAARHKILTGHPKEAIALWQEVVDNGPKVFGPDSPHMGTCQERIEEARAGMDD